MSTEPSDRYKVCEQPLADETACRRPPPASTRSRRHERRVEPAERAAVRHHVGNHRNAGAAEALRIVGNDDCPIDHAAQPRQLTVENGRAAGLQNSPLCSAPQGAAHGRRRGWLPSTSKSRRRRKDIRRMNRAGVGRMLVASLHQGISDLLPTRLEFYENWLNPPACATARSAWRRWRPCSASCGRKASRTASSPRAGEYAAQWTLRQSDVDRALVHPRAAGDAARARGDAARRERSSAAAIAAAAPCAKLRRGAGHARRCAARSSARCASRSTGRCACSIRRRSSHLLRAGRRQRRSARARVSRASAIAACIIAVNVPPDAEMTMPVRFAVPVARCWSAGSWRPRFAGSPPRSRAARARRASSSFRSRIPAQRRARSTGSSEASAVLLADDLNALGQARATRARSGSSLPAAAGAARRHA